jgi:hypothetical protein
MTDQHYRRGQIFGFTIAEAVLLLFFSLLLLLASALREKDREIDDYEVDRQLRVEIQNALAQYGNDPQKFFIVIEEFRQEAKNRLKAIEQDSVKYEEYRELMLVLAREVDMQGESSDVIRKLIALITAGEKLAGSPADEMSKEELKLVSQWYRDAVDNTSGGQETFEKKLQELVDEQAESRKKLQQLRKERNYLRAELSKFDGKEGKSGFGLPPCWIDDRNRGMRPFVVTMLPGGYVLNPSKDFEAGYQQRFYERLGQDKARWGSLISPGEFRSFVAAYRELGLSESDDKCQFWAGVVDCLPNDKELYKTRISALASGLRVFREDSSAECTAPR